MNEKFLFSLSTAPRKSGYCPGAPSPPAHFPPPASSCVRWNSPGLRCRWIAVVLDELHPLQKLTRYMMAYSGEFRRAFQMLREAQAARRDEADGTEWEDVESVQTEIKADGCQNDESDDVGDDGGGPDDGPAGGSSAALEATPSPVDQAHEFVLGPDWKSRADCSTARRKVDPRASRDEARRDASSPTRWNDLTEEERILFAVRNKNRVLAANEIVDEVLLDPVLIERMSASGLIRTSAALNSMIWQTTLGIDKLIEQEERREEQARH